MRTKSGAKLLLLDSEDNALILRRSGTHPHIPFTTDLPGGELDVGEDPIDGVCRETFEETQVIIDKSAPTLIGQRSFVAFGIQYDLYLYVMHCSQRPDVTISWEHDQFTWKPVAEVHDLDEGFQPMIDAYLQADK